MLQFKPVEKLRHIDFQDSHTWLRLDIIPVFIVYGLLRVVNPDFIMRHILKHRMDATMMEIIEFGFAEIKEVDDTRDFRAGVFRV